MALQYPLLFPYGEDGYHPDIPYATTTEKAIKRKCVTMLEFYAYQIQTRLLEGTTLVRSGRLLHQYAVDAYMAIEQERMGWYRRNQKTLRADVYHNICDAIDRGDSDAMKVGRRIILPSSFTGGPRYMAQNYHDAMAICRTFGNPDLFITMTANPNWEEIKEHLQRSGNFTANDRPDLESCVFKMKLESLVADLWEGEFFGEAKSIVYTIEFQKRGLPHAHILVWLQDDLRTPTNTDIDKIITAEIPDESSDPEGYKLVEQFMTHGPCGKDNPNLSCTENGICTRGFPKPYTRQTEFDDKGFVTYRRRHDLRNYITKGGTKLDKRFVVPHNLELLKKYKCHINVEWCCKTEAIKYLFKYVTKGVDKATIVVEKTKGSSGGDGSSNPKNEDVDEIRKYQECRYLSACEAMWRIFAFDIHYSKPAVQRLTLHLREQQPVTYSAEQSLDSVIARPGIDRTMFTEWMKMNETDPFARTLTYTQFPQWYVWNITAKTWTRRKQGHTIGRIVNIHPTVGELYYMRLLLGVVIGPTSYDDILTVDGIVYEDFKGACLARGMLDGDKEWVEALEKTHQWGFPCQLRSLFETLLIYSFVSSPLNLWNHCWRYMADDIEHTQQKKLKLTKLHLREEQLKNYTLLEIEKILQQHDRTLSDFPDMPMPDNEMMKELCNSYLMEEQGYDEDEQQPDHDLLFGTLNDKQRLVFDGVMDSVENGEGRFFFLNGPGGTGKTYVYRTLITKLRAMKKIVLPVASSGIAALLLQGGRTAHSRFKIPITLHEHSMCEIKKGSMLAELIRKTDLIIWDEAPMTHRFAFEAVDRSMRDLLAEDDPKAMHKIFGGKTVLLGGDFRQILPVIPGAVIKTQS
ncbi:PREDICTED: uncharacterized protein LOC104715846 [Camelina sativa]|uniref:ATP-dependent DNA helicase n=1 Tax=Camelina sativa TaxID=90675 RepID=A0ABM0TU83_CAMSA|nr:PREDICTED: uncharacterized protein LOC104715846 [Camelina sativa]